MSLADLIQADAKSAVDEAGEAVTYHVLGGAAGGGSDVPLQAVVRRRALTPRDTDDRRSLASRVEATVARLDLPGVAAPTPNADAVTVPGRYFGQADDYRARVSALEETHTNAGTWTLVLS